MKNRRYRIDTLPEVCTMAELSKYVFAEAPVQPEPGEFSREGQYYCQNPECSIREVQIHLKKTAPTPAAMHCPACAKPLKFHYWMKSVPITLLVHTGTLDQPESP